MNLKEKLNYIQTKLNAPKSQYNSFGKYSYRNAEDILNALKPLLNETKATITLDDLMMQIGERYYIKATATISDCESDEKVSVSAYAREEQEKKGMDASQITGSTSSYARKYALNGLFAIDDVKDSDTTNQTEKATQQVSLATESQVKTIKTIYDLPNIAKILKYYQVERIENLTVAQASEVIKNKNKGKDNE